MFNWYRPEFPGELEQALNNPVKPEPRKPPPAPKNETTTRGKPPKSKP